MIKRVLCQLTLVYSITSFASLSRLLPYFRNGLIGDVSVSSKNAGHAFLTFCLLHNHKDPDIKLL